MLQQSLPRTACLLWNCDRSPIRQTILPVRPQLSVQSENFRLMWYPLGFCPHQSGQLVKNRDYAQNAQNRDSECNRLCLISSVMSSYTVSRLPSWIPSTPRCVLAVSSDQSCLRTFSCFSCS